MFYVNIALFSIRSVYIIGSNLLRDVALMNHGQSPVGPIAHFNEFVSRD